MTRTSGAEERSAASSLGQQRRRWIHSDTAFAHLEVQVRPGASPRRADGGQGVADLDPLADTNIDPLSVRIARDRAVGALHLDDVAVAARGTGFAHRAGRDARDRCTGGRGDVDAMVGAVLARDRIGARTKSAGDPRVAIDGRSSDPFAWQRRIPLMVIVIEVGVGRTCRRRRRCTAVRRLDDGFGDDVDKRVTGHACVTGRFAKEVRRLQHFAHQQQVDATLRVSDRLHRPFIGDGAQQ